jgi:hypothetical protein
MPQRIITIWTCSLCPEETENGEKIKHYSLSEGKRSIVLDVCTNCEMTEPFATIWSAGLNEKVGARTARPAEFALERDGTVKCRFCEDWFSPMGMGLHQSTAHGVKSKTQIELEQRGKTGKFPCDGCDFKAQNPTGLAAHRKARHPPAVISNPCPDCDFVGANPQGLGAHRRHVHPDLPRLGHGKRAKVK